MSQNEQTYSRAITASLVGLGTQAALAIAMGLLGLYAHAPALHAAAWHLIGGLPIWIIIWALFNQHRLERQEARQAQALADDDAQAAALFEEAGQQLAVAQRSLERIYKWGINIVSLFAGLYLLGLGGLLLYVNKTAYTQGLLAGAIGPQTNLVLVMLLLVMLGFAAFLVARYVAGMTTEKDWLPLRGAAAYLMGNAFVAGLVLIAAALAYFEVPQGFVYAALVIPAIMVLLGVEIMLALLLGIYRPRKAGQFVRPAFDSRILGWLTRPESIGKTISDTLNYQFGFEISRSWFYRLTAQLTLPLLAVALAVLLAMSSLVFVAPQQNAIITTFGQIDRIEKPGLAFKWPWPISRADKYDVYRIQEIVLGSRYEEFDPDVALLWTNAHGSGDEIYLVTAPAMAPEDQPTAADIAAGELVGCNIVVKYRIHDLEQYATSANQPKEVLQALAEQVVNQYFATHDIDSLLTRGRLDASDTLLHQIRKQVEQEKLGIEIAFVTVSAVHPPQKSEVADKFHEQISASQEKLTAIEKAKQQAQSTLASVAGSRDKALQLSKAIEHLNSLQSQTEANPDDADLRQQYLEQSAAIELLMDDAGGQAAQELASARAFRWEYAITELSRTERFTSELLAYRKAPNYYKMQLYLEALGQAIQDRRKIVIDSPTDQDPRIRLMLEDASSGLGKLFQDQP